MKQVKRKQADHSTPDGAWVRCLGCNKMFYAQSKFNRTCWECKQMVSWSGERRDVTRRNKDAETSVEFHKESNGYMCYAPGCRGLSKIKGLCGAHYKLKWRTGGLERRSQSAADLLRAHAQKCYANVIGAERMMYWRAELRKAERMINQGAPRHARTGNP